MNPAHRQHLLIRLASAIANHIALLASKLPKGETIEVTPISHNHVNTIDLPRTSYNRARAVDCAMWGARRHEKTV